MNLAAHYHGGVAITFDEEWEAAVVEAGRLLAARSPEAAALAGRIAKPSFPGALTLLAGSHAGAGQAGREFRRDVAASVASSPAAQARGIDARTAERVLGLLAVDRVTPSATGQPDEIVRLVVSKALERQGLTVSEAELGEIVRLLETGRFFGDLMGTAGAIFTAIPRLPKALLADLRGLPKLPLAGIHGLVRDLFDLLGTIGKVAVDLRDGKIDEPPAVMTRLLALLYGVGTIAQVRDLLRRVLAPENRSVRLALLLYARSNGFDVTEQQLDTVYENLLASDTPQLGPVLAEALEVLKSRYHGDELAAVLGALQRTGG